MDKAGMRGLLFRVWPLSLTLSLLAALLSLTIGDYYGYYYDNKFFNLLALELWESPRLYLYIGSHYHVPSSLFSYLLYPFYLALGPGDLATELLAAFFHLGAVILCYMLGSRLHSASVGFVFSLFAAFAPIHLVQVYTLPDLSFAVFLNILSVYLFMTGVKGRSFPRLISSAFVFSLACFQAIYYIILLPFYLLYSASLLSKGAPRGAGGVPENPRRRRTAVIAASALFAFVLAAPAYAYLLLLYRASFGLGNAVPLAAGAAFAAGAFIYIKRPALRDIAAFAAFPLAFAALIAYYDLAVQIDCLFLKGTLGYYLDATPAGGYGGRPAVHFMGKDLEIFGYPLQMSVITSMFEFAGKDFAKASFYSLEGLGRLYNDYFVISYASSVRALFFAGLLALAVKAALKAGRDHRAPILYIYPFIWLMAAAAPYLNLGPPYFNIRRIYILPLPFLFAAFGVEGVADVAGCALKRLTGAVTAERLKKGVMIILSVAVTADQFSFSVEKIYKKYLEDKKDYMYFKLYYGHFYGRSYSEAGEFLLKDAPLRDGGPVRAAVVYTIPEDTRIGRSLPLFNTINWYTRNQILIMYYFKDRSIERYGTRERLEAYLEDIFSRNPSLTTVYFADFVDYSSNFSFFPRAHPYLKPYKIVDDDGSLMYDCVLYKFERGTWRGFLSPKTPHLALPS